MLTGHIATTLFWWFEQPILHYPEVVFLLQRQSPDPKYMYINSLAHSLAEGSDDLTGN